LELPYIINSVKHILFRMYCVKHLLLQYLTFL